MKSAAYAARASYRDERIGERFSYRGKGGLLSHELVNWAGDAEALWNAAERAESRGNARVIRELRPSLPAELPLEQQVRLVRGFCLWLRDEFGTAAQANIHAPRFKDPEVEAALEEEAGPFIDGKYIESMFNPEVTNLNFHAHILMTTREVDPLSGAFGGKTRRLDDRKSGPDEVRRIRAEWEKRTNAALERAGVQARIDLRSYAEMSAAGDAPDGLIPQSHMGPARAARTRNIVAGEQERFLANVPLLARPSQDAIRKKTDSADWDTSSDGIRREATRRHNDCLWQNWLMRRAQGREEARASETGIAVAVERERKRKRDVRLVIERLKAARTPVEAEFALQKLRNLDAVGTKHSLKATLQNYLREASYSPPDEFSREIDLESFVPPASSSPEPFLETRIVRVSSRVR